MILTLWSTGHIAIGYFWNILKFAIFSRLIIHVLGPCQTSLMETPPSLFSCVMRCVKNNKNKKTKKKHGNKNKSNDRKEELGPIQ